VTAFIPSPSGGGLGWGCLWGEGKPFALSLSKDNLASRQK